MIIHVCKKALDNQKTATQRAVGSIKGDYLALKKENEMLHKKLTKLEFYQRQNNINFVGIPEKRGENVDAKVVVLLNKNLDQSMQLTNHTFEN